MRSFLLKSDRVHQHIMCFAAVPSELAELCPLLVKDFSSRRVLPGGQFGSVLFFVLFLLCPSPALFLSGSLFLFLCRALRMEARNTVYQISQSSQEQWTKETTEDSKWKEITNVLNEMGSLIKERNGTWHESCRVDQKREQDLLSTAEELRTQGSKDENDRTALVNGIRRLNKLRDDEEKHLKKVKETLSSY